MSDSRLSTGIWRFGVFEVDLHAEELRKNGIKIHLQGQPFHVLTVLLTRAGQLVSREEMRRAVWPGDTFVEFDHALNTAIKKIRCALGDDATAPRYVQTISRRGYRFIGDVHAVAVWMEEEDRSGARPVGAPQSLEPKAQNQDLSIFWMRAGKALVASAILALIAVQFTHRSTAARNQVPPPIMLAVLPFDDWSDGSELAYFGEGVSQELITQFSRMDPPRLAVAARTCVQAYRHSSKTVTELGKELHADYLVQGNLRGDRRHVRISAELVRVSDQARLWGDDFDLPDGNVLQMETNLAQSITAKIRAIVIAPGS